MIPSEGLIMILKNTEVVGVIAGIRSKGVLLKRSIRLFKDITGVLVLNHPLSLTFQRPATFILGKSPKGCR